ncbi:MAG: ParB N-terminal domain-containing protein [Caulobacter sp.]
MTIQTNPVLQHGTELSIPLNKLKTSPRNARRTRHSEADIATLAASIEAKGVLQPPVVEPELDRAGAATGSYLVTIGEGRRQALRLLAKRKVIAKDAPIRCLLDTSNDAFEISLDENVTRFAMHPADQFEAFRKLADEHGLSAEEIATRFGVSAHTVRQRLALAAVSPALMAQYRGGEMTLEQLMAFTVTEDHDRQEQVFAALPYNRSPSTIRRMLTETEVEATERRAVLVGPEAYQAAGGRIRRDLFSEDRGGWFEDAALLDRLVLERLQAVADQHLAQGWRWAEVHIDFPHSHGLRRLHPTPVEPDADTKAKVEELRSTQEATILACEEGTIEPEDADRTIEDIEATIADLIGPAFTDEVRAKAGVFVSLSWDGAVRIDRGFVRAEDEAREIDQGPPWDDDTKAHTPKRPKPLSERLISDLTAHRTLALRDQIANRPDDALLVLLHALALATFYPGADGTCVEMRALTTHLGGYATGINDTETALAANARHEQWAARLPEDSKELWSQIVALEAGDRSALLAHCVARSINAVQHPARPRRALAHADALASHLGLDMRRYWQASAAGYFNHVTKDQIVEAVAEGVSQEKASSLIGLKKDAMASAAADLLGADGWLPPLLRTAAADPA